jgi:flagella basal body P-ring formation protein FlgA
MIGLCALIYLILGHFPMATAAGGQLDTAQVPVDDVAQLVTRYLLERFPEPRQQVQVTNVRLQGNLQVPSGLLTYDIMPRTRRLAPGPVSLTVVVRVDGKAVRRLLASATLSMSTQVVVAAAPLARHQMISRADIRLAEVDLARLPEGVITNPEDVVGKWVRHNVSLGTPLHERLVEAPTVITRGAVVTIVAQSASVSVTVPGQAKEDGAVGEQIRVLNLSSRKEVYAKVLDEHTVRVDF